MILPNADASAPRDDDEPSRSRAMSKSDRARLMVNFELKRISGSCNYVVWRMASKATLAKLKNNEIQPVGVGVVMVRKV